MLHIMLTKENSERESQAQRRRRAATAEKEDEDDGNVSHASGTQVQASDPRRSGLSSIEEFKGERGGFCHPFCARFDLTQRDYNVA